MTEATLDQVVAAIHARRRFVVTSHARPDGDAIGSQVAMGLALRALGKDVRLVDVDPPPPPMRDLPGIGMIEVTPAIDDPGDAVITMECGDINRPGVEGLARGFVINIDHHPGNTGFGALNWIDLSASACGEMVFDLIVALGAPLTPEIATHIYLTILTDTGQFHYSHVTPRTFEICRRCVEAGADPTALSRAIYDNNSLGRVRLFGAVLDQMELDPTGRVATLVMDRAMAARCGGTYDDTEGLINFPLTVRDIHAVIFFKESAPDDWRISMRSKGPVNINAVAKEFGGGGHINASGCGAKGRLDDLKRLFEAKVAAAVAVAEASQPNLPHGTSGTMNGVVVVDKPRGPTSHDVVAAARRALREKSIGHTGTLDPLATGVLALACGKATRLVRFLSASDKDYEATLRFGLATDSYDTTGRVVLETAARPTREAVAAALASLAGERLQTPPAYSAKKVDGHRAYDLARQARPVEVAPVKVTLAASEIVAWSGDDATIRLTCSAGFYVRTLVHEIGRLVGTGACLSALCRTRSGRFTLGAAAGMDALMTGGAAVIPMSDLLPELSAVHVDAEGVQRVLHGRDLSRQQYQTTPSSPSPDVAGWTRVLGPTGDLVAVASPGGVPGVLHPAVVLI